MVCWGSVEMGVNSHAISPSSFYWDCRVGGGGNSSPAHVGGGKGEGQEVESRKMSVGERKQV